MYVYKRIIDESTSVNFKLLQYATMQSAAANLMTVMLCSVCYLCCFIKNRKSEHRYKVSHEQKYFEELHTSQNWYKSHVFFSIPSSRKETVLK